MELLRNIKVSAEIETNKQTIKQDFSLEDYDTIDELSEDLASWLRNNTPSDGKEGEI